MKKRMLIVFAATFVVGLSSLLFGCDREVSKTKSSSVSSDGTVRSKEKTVTQTTEGTVTKTQESKTTAPNNR